MAETSGFDASPKLLVDGMPCGELSGAVDHDIGLLHQVVQQEASARSVMQATCTSG
jgi:hypothetical protein